MKVAEIFAELGFKIEGAGELKAFDALLKSIASSARDAAAALKALSGVKLPSRTAAPTGVTSPTTVAVPSPSALPPPPGALPPTATPPAGASNTAANQGMKSLTTFVKQLVGIGSLAYVLKSLIGGFSRMVKSSAEASFGLERFTRQTGLSTEEEKRWAQIAAANGLKAEEIQESLKSIQQNAVDISLGRGGTNANRFGIDPLIGLTNPAGVFKAFQDVTKSMSQAAAMAVADSAGIDARIASMLLRERDHPTKTVGGITLSGEELESVRGLGSALGVLKVTASSLADKITSDVAPALTKAAGFFTDLFTALIRYDEFRKTVGKQMLSPWVILPMMAPNTSAKGAATTINNAPVVNIHGVSDPQAAGREAVKQWDRMISDANYGRASPYLIAPTEP